MITGHFQVLAVLVASALALGAVTVHIVTRQKQFAHALSQRLIQAQEQERARIARELHDDIGQRLAILTIELAGQSSVCEKQAAEIAADVQALSRELHTSRLELLGLATSMENLCATFARRHDLVVDFELHDLPDGLAPDISLCLFRVLQEALHNATKHSGVRRFDVRVWGSARDVNLTVGDRGAGFNLPRVRSGRGLGLVSMEERLKLVDGDLSIQTRPGDGTSVHARVPLCRKRSDGSLAGGRSNSVIAS